MINALSLTSQSYRALVLEAWFRTLFIESPGDLLFLRDSGWFPNLRSKWARHLHCVRSFRNTHYVWNLSSFLRVSSIRLDWLSLTLTSSFIPPHAGLDTLPFLHLASTVEHFDLRGDTSPKPETIQCIANTAGFGCLKTLKMVRDTMWCELCQLCCLVRFEDRPTGVVYEGGLGLPIDYARVLALFEYLEEVVIIMPNHGFGDTTLGSNADSDSGPNADTNPQTTTTSNTKVNPNLWSGECNICMLMKYDDDVFREKWVARKRRVGLACGDGDNDDGQEDVRPPSLRRVEYRFSTVDDGEEEDYEDVATDSELDIDGLEWN